jgi:hypothetical protein
MPFRTVRRSPKYRDGLSPGRWAYHFFDSTALKPTMSKACSATNCFQLAVLFFQLTEPLRLAHFQPALLRLPAVERLFADAMLAA